MLALLFLALVLSCCNPCYGGDWTLADSGRQIAVTALLSADWVQTRQIAEHPEYCESNAILGRHPSIGAVNAYFVSVAGVHAAISYLLPATWRREWQYITLGVEGAMVANNARLGVKFRF